MVIRSWPQTRTNAKPRARRLFLEQLEHRLVLASAVDDFYQVNVNDTLTVTGDGPLGNDQYTRSGWGTAGWVETSHDHHDGYTDPGQGYHEAGWASSEWIPPHDEFVFDYDDGGNVIGGHLEFVDGHYEYSDWHDDPWWDVPAGWHGQALAMAL